MDGSFHAPVTDEEGSPDSWFGLRLDDSFVRSLPGEAASGARGPRGVHGACYSRVAPTPVRAPRLLIYVPEVAASLGLPESPSEAQRQALAEVLGGNVVAPGMSPYAACYGGHQFGHWAGQLGDGRAITLAEVQAQGVSPAPRRWDLQLKGAGPTPYSRSADGRAVLRSSLRELVASEAMHHLGVPTTRALSLVGTGDVVIRDMFYDGHPQAEPGAIVCRVAPTFLRFGNYEIFTSRDDLGTLRRLLDYTVATHAPHLGAPSPAVYGAWLGEVAAATARLMVAWMRVGFTHGVMNTDNMSVLGLTIDYGPFGFLDAFDPAFTPNTTDFERRRYRFGQQAAIARWNVLKLGEAVFPLLESVAPIEHALALYAEVYAEEQRRMLAAKLGLAGLEAEDVALCEELFVLLQAHETDYTLFFRGLGAALVANQGLSGEVSPAAWAALAGAFYPAEGEAEAALAPEVRARWEGWLARYFARGRAERGSPEERRRAMEAVNPLYVFRNYLAQEAIDAAERGELALVHEMLDTLRRPYIAQEGRERFAQRRPDWARRRPGCSMLSCSS